MQPLIVAIVAARFFGEQIRRRHVVAALIAIAAVIVVVIESSGTSEWAPWRSPRRRCGLRMERLLHLLQAFQRRPDPAAVHGRHGGLDSADLPDRRGRGDRRLALRR